MSSTHKLEGYKHLFVGTLTAQEIATLTNVDANLVYSYANARCLPLRRTYLTAGMKYEIGKMLSTGKSGEEIATALNCEVELIEKHALEASKEKRNAKRRAKKREMVSKIKELVQLGDTVNEIVGKTGYKRDSVYAIIRQNNLKLNATRTAYHFTEQEKEYVSQMPFLTNVELLRILGKHIKCDVDAVRKEKEVKKTEYYAKDVITMIVNEGVGEAAEFYEMDEDILSNMTYACDFGMCPIKDVEISIPARLKGRMESAEIEFMLQGGDSV